MSANGAENAFETNVELVGSGSLGEGVGELVERRVVARVELTLRFHAASLASPHDSEGQVPLDRSDFRRLFLDNTPWASYVARARAAFSADYRDQLSNIQVPTLVLTPSHDELIGDAAATQMVDGIPDANEIVLDRTGHMFRFTHPHTYAQAIEEFLAARVDHTPVPTR